MGQPSVPVSMPQLLAELREFYPEPQIELRFDNPLQLLVATILAAQCPDARVNEVTRELFATYPDAASYAAAKPEELEQALRSINFYRRKATAIHTACQILVDRYQGNVPQTLEELTELPGVARKTANVILSCAYSIAAGFIVDTHVLRVAQRLGLTRQKNAEKAEEDLMKIVPRADWIHAALALILHGRYLCTSNAPACDRCPFHRHCPKIGVAP